MKRNFKKITAVFLAVLAALSVMYIPTYAATSTAGPVCGTDKSYYKGNSMYEKKYSWFTERYLPESSYIIPGLTSTEVEGQNCTQMVPQGICFAGDYVLISAYDYEKKIKSVIYVMDRAGKFLTLLTIDDKEIAFTHNGALAFDGNYVWMLGKPGDSVVCAIPYIQVVAAVYSGLASCPVSVFPLKTEKKASFILCRDGLLWVGTFAQTGDNYLTSYTYDPELPILLTKYSTIVLPDRVQGAEFYDRENGDVILAVSRSLSRSTLYDSYISEIDLYNMSSSVFSNIASPTVSLPKRERRIDMPPMIEDLAVDGGNLYVVFESAAYEYRVNSASVNPIPNFGKYPIDLAAAIPLKALDEQGDVVIGFTLFERIVKFLTKVVNFFRALVDKPNLAESADLY
ncbi:MAG: hypothetical protein K6F09_09120 [Clostridiales bacterium]|nr:hypothetical protein [Clostridiales bacterium]